MVTENFANKQVGLFSFNISSTFSNIFEKKPVLKVETIKRTHSFQFFFVRCFDSKLWQLLAREAVGVVEGSLDPLDLGHGAGAMAATVLVLFAGG
jgi:hypothetical protein